MDAAADLVALLASLPAQGVTVEPKAGKWYWRALDLLVRIATLGQLTSFMTDFVTTLGHSRIGLPSNWDRWPASLRLSVLRHELVHVAQSREWGVLQGLSWLLLPLPVGLAWFRYRWEREAYVESIRVILRYEPGADLNALIEGMVERFTGPDYGWAWVFPNRIRKWFQAQDYGGL